MKQNSKLTVNWVDDTSDNFIEIFQATESSDLSLSYMHDISDSYRDLRFNQLLVDIQKYRNLLYRDIKSSILFTSISENIADIYKEKFYDSKKSEEEIYQESISAFIEKEFDFNIDRSTDFNINTIIEQLKQKISKIQLIQKIYASKEKDEDYVLQQLSTISHFDNLGEAKAYKLLIDHIIKHGYDKKMMKSLNALDHIALKLQFYDKFNSKIYYGHEFVLFMGLKEFQSYRICADIYEQLNKNLDKGKDVVVFIDHQYKEICKPMMNFLCRNIDIDKIKSIECNFDSIETKLKPNLKSFAVTTSTISTAAYLAYNYDFSTLGILGVSTITALLNGVATASISCADKDRAYNCFIDRVRSFEKQRNPDKVKYGKFTNAAYVTGSLNGSYTISHS